MNTDIVEAQNQFVVWEQNFYAHPSGGIEPSRLYTFLAQRVARDSALLASVLTGIEGDLLPSIPSRFFAATHFLLLALEQEPHPLAAYYSDMVAKPLAPGEDGYQLFRSFCLEHAKEIRHLIQTRHPSLNDVGRCSVLLPALCLVAQRYPGRPLAHVDIGSSAGLHLLWPYYGYRFPPYGVCLGDPHARVQLECKLEGERFPPLPEHLPRIFWRQGIDLRPLRATSEEDCRWLRAVMVPEHAAELWPRLSRALQLARESPPIITAGEASSQFERVVAGLPPDVVLCVTHSYTLLHMAPASQARFLESIAAQAQRRTLFRIAQEFYPGASTPTLELYSYAGTRVQRECLATCDGYGRWFRWEGPSSSSSG